MINVIAGNPKQLIYTQEGVEFVKVKKKETVQYKRVATTGVELIAPTSVFKSHIEYCRTQYIRVESETKREQRKDAMIFPCFKRVHAAQGGDRDLWGYQPHVRQPFYEQVQEQMSHREIKMNNNVLEWHREGRGNSGGREEKHGDELEGRVHRVVVKVQLNARIRLHTR